MGKAPYRQTILRGCVRKRRFGTKGEAETILHRLQSYKDTAPQYRAGSVYECANCHGWHIASKAD